LDWCRNNKSKLYLGLCTCKSHWTSKLNNLCNARSSRFGGSCLSKTMSDHWKENHTKNCNVEWTWCLQIAFQLNYNVPWVLQFFNKVHTRSPLNVAPKKMHSTKKSLNAWMKNTYFLWKEYVTDHASENEGKRLALLLNLPLTLSMFDKSNDLQDYDGGDSLNK
jgi:hypothetical protein